MKKKEEEAKARDSDDEDGHGDVKMTKTTNFGGSQFGDGSQAGKSFISSPSKNLTMGSK